MEDTILIISLYLNTEVPQNVLLLNLKEPSFILS